MNNTYISNKKYYLAIFDSKNIAIKLYYTLQKRGITKFNLVSAPCQLKAGCNYSIKFDNLEYFKILHNILDLDNKNIGVELYKIERINGKKEIDKLHYSI